MALRGYGSDLPITAWLWNAQEDLTEALASRICIGVPSLEHAKALVNTEVPARVYVKVETGMHRSGVDEKDWDRVFELLHDAPQIEVLGLMSHFACADEPTNPYNDVQEENF